MSINPYAPLSLLSVQQIMESDLSPVDWLVQGLIAQGDRVLFFGEPGSFKTWLLIDLAVHIATGKPWLGQFQIPHAKRVLYVDEEMNVHTLSRRIKRLTMEAALNSQSLPLRVSSHNGLRLGENGAADLLAALKQSNFDPDVIIVDSLRRVLVGNENEAKDVGQFWRNVEPICKTGKTLILAHHMRKPSLKGVNDPQYRASGSTDLIAGTDTALAVRKIAQSRTEIQMVKSRNAEEARPFALSLNDTSEESPVVMRFEEYLAGSEAVQTETERAKEEILTFLQEATKPLKPGLIQAHVIGQGFKRRTYQRAWEAVRGSGKAQKVPGGNWQLRSDEDVAA